MRSSPPRRPTGLNGRAEPAAGELHANGGAGPALRQGGSGRRARGVSMLKQDSIAEESDSRATSPCPPSASTMNAPATSSFPFLPHRNHSTGSQLSDSQPLSPRLVAARLSTHHSPTAVRKGSLSPNAAPSSSHSLSNPRASTRRRGFQRGPSLSTAQSDVTEITRPAVIEPQLQGSMSASCENTNRIRFDISSGGSSLRNSNSSTLFPRSTLPVPPTVIGGSGGGSLKANGFVPRINSGLPRDVSRWHLSITKQRSQSESAFNANSRQLGLPGTDVDGVSPSGSTGFPSVSYHHDAAGILTAVRVGGGGSASLSGCPSNRRCSLMNILNNPHKEQAILRRILGPGALDWLKNRELWHKSGRSRLLSIRKKSARLIVLFQAINCRRSHFR